MSCQHCIENEDKIRRQKSELQQYERRCKDKTRQLKALHFVFCSGPCGNVGGSDLTEDIVEEAIRNTYRLVISYCNSRKTREAPKNKVKEWKEMIDKMVTEFGGKLSRYWYSK